MLDFLCVGAQKAGTSWLHFQLKSIPFVCFPHGKEVHYWDWVERGKRPKDPGWYSEKFNENSDLLCGDMTPCYALLSSDSIKEIHQLYPKVKIIYIIRNPIDRAWSGLKMGVSIMRMEPHEVSRQGMHDVLHSASSIERGNHLKVIKKWVSVFGKDQVLVKNYEEIVSDKVGFLTDVYNFLDIDLKHLDSIDKGLLNRQVNKGMDMPMPDDIRQELCGLYENMIRDLEVYLKKDFEHWCKK